MSDWLDGLVGSGCKIADATLVSLFDSETSPFETEDFLPGQWLTE